MKQHYLFPDWPVPPHIKSCVTLRFGGSSLPPFDSFNLSTFVSDDPAAVARNQQQLCQELSLKKEPVWLKQVHGICAIPLDESTPAFIEADASYTDCPNVVCAVLTADCLPILLCHRKGEQVAAIHAGWRGLWEGVIQSTVSSLKGQPDEWLAWLGPCIGPNKFEIGTDIYEQFISRYPEAIRAFREILEPFEEKKWLGDMYLLATQQLNALGITQIYGGSLCTYSDPGRFYSYRRDQGTTGRMASLIYIN